MNLYRILFRHYGPKDSEEGIKTYLLARDEHDVYHFIDKEYAYWEEYKEDGDIGKESMKEKMIRLKGDINDGYFDCSDAFYGVTAFGWELVEKNTPPTPYLASLVNIGVIINHSEWSRNNM